MMKPINKDKVLVLPNWSDYLHVADNTDNESMDQTEPPTDPNQPTTSTGTQVPQDTCADANTVVRLPQ